MLRSKAVVRCTMELTAEALAEEAGAGPLPAVGSRWQVDDCGFEAKVLSAVEESASRLQPEQAKLHLCSSLQDVARAQEGMRVQ